MRKLNEEEVKNINGGDHYHWVCYPHRYVSIARNFTSCVTFKNTHNSKYHNGNSTASIYTCTMTSGSCANVKQY